MRLVVLLLAGGCAASAPALPATHPATASAPQGRLAGAPPSLRAGAVTYPEVPPLRTGAEPDHHHNH
jgi:hypothetical protein